VGRLPYPCPQSELCRDAEVVEKAADAALAVVADGPDVGDRLACGVVRRGQDSGVAAPW
jgi:hypothetical protein